MDFCFCIPIIFGCPTKVKPDGEHNQRLCPRCNNASVFSAKSRTWFELCWVPLIPMKSKHIWMCGICQWNVPAQAGWEPAAVGGHGYNPGPQQGYQPVYTNQPAKQN